MKEKEGVLAMYFPDFREVENMDGETTHLIEEEIDFALHRKGDKLPGSVLRRKSKVSQNTQSFPWGNGEWY